MRYITYGMEVSSLSLKHFTKYKFPWQSTSHNAKFQHIGGAPPELLLLNKYDQELERIDLKKLSQEEINDLMLKKGFYKKSSREEEVPEEYREGPYSEKEEL